MLKEKLNQLEVGDNFFKKFENYLNLLTLMSQVHSTKSYFQASLHASKVSQL